MCTCSRKYINVCQDCEQVMALLHQVFPDGVACIVQDFLRNEGKPRFVGIPKAGAPERVYDRVLNRYVRRLQLWKLRKPRLDIRHPSPSTDHDVWIRYKEYHLPLY